MTRHSHRLLNRNWLFLLSLFLVFRSLAAVACMIFFALGAYDQNIDFLYISGGCLGIILFLQLIHVMESGKINCPNCRSQILSSRRYAKHRQAKKLFGSYSLRLALQVLFTNTFLCQFCHRRYQWRGKHEDPARTSASSH